MLDLTPLRGLQISHAQLNGHPGLRTVCRFLFSVARAWAEGREADKARARHVNVQDKMSMPPLAGLSQAQTNELRDALVRPRSGRDRGGATSSILQQVSAGALFQNFAAHNLHHAITRKDELLHQS